MVTKNANKSFLTIPRAFETLKDFLIVIINMHSVYANGLDTHCLLWRRGSFAMWSFSTAAVCLLGKWHKVQIPLFSSARGYGTVLLIMHAKNTNRRQRHHYLQDLAPKVHHRILFSKKLAWVSCCKRRFIFFLDLTVRYCRGKEGFSVTMMIFKCSILCCWNREKIVGINHLNDAPLVILI